MRISVDENDPGYDEKAISKGTYKVLLNGEEVTLCITADEEKGYVKKYKLDDNGEPVTSHDPGGNLVVEKEEVYGDVEVVDTSAN